MDEIVTRVARAIARKDNPQILDGSERGARLWEERRGHYTVLAVAALDAVIANGLGEDEQAGQGIPGKLSS